MATMRFAAKSTFLYWLGAALLATQGVGPISGSPFSVSHADENGGRPYSFGGACSSQGTWTATALQATLKIREVALQLKNNKNCTGLREGIIAALDELSKKTSEVDSAGSAMNQLSAIPAELGALRSFIGSSPEVRGDVMKLIFNKAMTGATLSAKVQEDSGSLGTAGEQSGKQRMAFNMLDFGARIHRTTNDGMVLIEQFLDNMPHLQECLTEDNLMGPLLSSSTALLSSFMSAGVTGSSMARLVAKLSGAMHDSHYAAILRKLNEQEFLASTACLLEMTSEAYCTARDAMVLFQDEMNTTRFENNSAGGMDPNSPFLGYYLLSQQVPIITRWLQKVQIGVNPQLVTDAQFQNGILQEVTDFQVNVKKLQAEYASRIATIQSQTTKAAQQGQVLELLKVIYAYMGENDYGGRGGSGINFFSTSVGGRVMRIPFDLIGIETPAQVSGNFEGNMMQVIPWDMWIQSHMDNLPVFQDPVRLARTIGDNMSRIITDANQSAIEYYSRWFLVDKQAIVNDSLTSITYSVKDSLIAINSYLDRLMARVRAHRGDPSIIGSILDTKGRIRHVLEAYGRLEAITRQLKGSTPDSQQPLEEIAKAAEDVVQTVYDEFMVMLAKTSFISNRMVTFVYYDYSMLIENQKDFTSYEKELFIAIGRTLVDNMIQMYSGNPANVVSDLKMALRINKGNIESVEMLLKDPLVAMIGKLRLAAESDNPNQASVANDSGKRLLVDSGMTGNKPIEKEHLGFWDGVKIYAKAWITPGAVPLKTIWHYFKHRDRYPMPDLFSKGSRSPDDEFGSAQSLRAQLCIQALAFNDLRPFHDLCENQVLQSPFPELAMQGSADPQKMRQYLSMSFTQKRHEQERNRALNHSLRICAFRDWNRRNMVMWMRLNSPAGKLGSPVSN